MRVPLPFSAHADSTTERGLWHVESARLPNIDGEQSTNKMFTLPDLLRAGDFDPSFRVGRE